MDGVPDNFMTFLELYNLLIEAAPPLVHVTNKSFKKYNSNMAAKNYNLGIHFAPPALGQHICSVSSPEGYRTIPYNYLPKNPIRLEDSMDGTWAIEDVVEQLINKQIADPDELDALAFNSKGKRLPELTAARLLRNYLLKKGYDAIIYKNRAEGLTDKKTGNPITADDFDSKYFTLYKKSDDEFFSVYNGHECYIIFNPNN